mmetsp:Transcript_28168/g.81592  ORF Transcript_28168/g.81592 Transcript_28168/m.81592 type:complete len:209 (+) Transcript_28168:793-1419(+)
MPSQGPRFLVKASKPRAMSEPMPEVCVNNCRIVIGPFADLVESPLSAATRGFRKRSATSSGKCFHAGSFKRNKPRSDKRNMPTAMKAFVMEYKRQIVSQDIGSPFAIFDFPLLQLKRHLSKQPSPVNAHAANPGQRPLSTMACNSPQISPVGKPSSLCMGSPPKVPPFGNKAIATLGRAEARRFLGWRRPRAPSLADDVALAGGIGDC